MASLVSACWGGEASPNPIQAPQYDGCVVPIGPLFLVILGTTSPLVVHSHVHPWHGVALGGRSRHGLVEFFEDVGLATLLGLTTSGSGLF